MGLLEVQHLVKYPPFEAHRLVASELPISKNNKILSDDIDQQRSALDKSNETDLQNNGNQDIIYSIIVITILSLLLLLALILLFI
jgi:hypothetical protein